MSDKISNFLKTFKGTLSLAACILVVSELAFYFYHDDTTIRENLGFCPCIFNASKTALWGFWSKPWGILTNAFVHVSNDHLFDNILFFLFFGGIIESALGSKKFVYIAFFSILISSILIFPIQFFYAQNDCSGTCGGIGASLLVYALSSFFLMWFMIEFILKRNPLPKNKALWVVYFAALLIILVEVYLLTTNSEHLPGFVSGILIYLSALLLHAI
ncbi:rhomboid family intramembrane serine protease [Candidatus Micrarchaeota archaeon]|nr:rhomboid family intramembrane serine protease [Candidatus Micrarchaeota archaeon]